MSLPLTTLRGMQKAYADPTHIQRRVNKKLDSQFGVISRKQALALGISRTEIETKLKKEIWVPVLPGIYKVGGSPATREQRLMAAVLWAGDGAVVSHRSAADPGDWRVTSMESSRSFAPKTSVLLPA